jgi:hypothetical protein
MALSRSFFFILETSCLFVVDIGGAYIVTS